MTLRKSFYLLTVVLSLAVFFRSNVAYCLDLGTVVSGAKTMLGANTKCEESAVSQNPGNCISSIESWAKKWYNDNETCKSSKCPDNLTCAQVAAMYGLKCPSSTSGSNSSNSSNSNSKKSTEDTSNSDSSKKASSTSDSKKGASNSSSSNSSSGSFGNSENSEKGFGSFGSNNNEEEDDEDPDEKKDDDNEEEDDEDPDEK